VGNGQRQLQKQSRFLHSGGKGAAFGRNDDFWVWEERTDKGNCNCKSSSRFLHCGGKCAAFGRNDGVWVMTGERKRATATATATATAKTKADFSTTAASAPPSVEMTGFG
jgi:hypothetical protein